MKHIFTYLLLWIGFAYVQAAPIYEMTPPDPLPMRSMRVMTSDIRYTGVTYAPFTAALPSEQSAASESSSGRPTGSIRRGFGKPNEIGKSEEYPIGEPWILAIFAILFAGFIAWKNKTSKELHLQYQKNNSTMKNKPSIQSARNRTKVGIKSVVNATKVLSPILIFAFLTLGVGRAWGWGGMVQGCLEYTTPSGNINPGCTTSSTTSTSEIGTVDYLNITGIWITNWTNNNNNDGTTISGTQLVWRLYDATKSSEGEKQFRTATTTGTYDGNNRQDSWTGTITPTTNSGEYYFKYYYETWFGGNTYPGNQYLPGYESYSQLHYKIRPPQVKEGNSFEVNASNKVTGTGTSSDPFVITISQNTTFTVTANKEHSDANSKLTVSFNNGSSWSTGASASTTSITSGAFTPDGTKRSITIQVKFVNSQASLESSTIASRTIYYIIDTKYNVTATYSGRGTITPTSVTEMSKYVGGNITASAEAGYTFTNWTITSGSGYFGSSGTSTSTTTANTKFRPTAVATIQANFSANQYTITFDKQSGSGGTNNATVHYDNDDFSVTTIVVPNRTGYNFAGYYTNTGGGGVQIVNASGVWQSSKTDYLDVSGNWIYAGNKTVYAYWTPKSYTVTLDHQTSAEGYGGNTGTVTNPTVTFDATPATVSGTMPTASQGYGFMGYYSAEDGGGRRFIDPSGNWITSAGDTISGGKWVKPEGITLYAYFKQAQITALTLSSGVVESGATVTAMPVIDPSPAGDTKLCWKILRSNGNLLTDDGFTSLSGNAVSFNAPTAGGTYKVACVLRTGSSCSGGTVLDSVVTDLVVASAHTVTIRYQDSEGRSLAAPVEMTGLPLEWSTAINPPAVTGYNFTRWEAGDGIFISTDGSTKIEEGTTTTPTIYMEAQYDGTLTAVYSKKRMIYFNNTLGWSAVYVYFYENNKYWGYGDNAGKGTGSNPSWRSQDNTSNPFKHKGAMTQIEGTNIWYYDCEANSVNASYTNVAFNENDQTNYDYFSATKVVRRGDYKSSLPMFVPLAGQTPATYNTSAKYYDEGYWMNYPENTGYTLHIYSGTTKEVLDEIRSIAFPFTADKTMPMEVTLELNANTTYGYEIHRADNTYYANSGTIKINASSDIKLSANQRGGVKTSAAGDYVFKLNFGNSSGYGYLFSVQYPASAGSYRLVYKDLAEWSQGSSHTDSWSHPSRVIYKNEGAADTVSFFVAKGHTPTIQIQKITSIDNEGNITWENVGSATSYDTVSAAGVYNFITSQTASALSIDKVEPYTGNYYIRTDAVDGKWDNYRTGADHLMTYSAFSEDRAQNTFGELFSHYKAKWCPRGTNVKFCIANDYSSCISDTLIQDVGNPYNNINEGGWLKTEDGKTELADKYSANIRFMWNRSTNKISRAYVSSSTNTAKKFLILKGQDTFWNSDGSNLSGSGESHANKEAIFQDNENWIYEREIKVTTGTKFKLFACYAQDSPSDANAQYFRGNYAEGAWTEGNYVILINGDGSGTCNARLIYDFKTNRLIAAYLPDGSAVSGETAIHADLMVIREHQGAGQQITFNTGGSLTEVKTVYGVMRFNRWILNNRQHPEDHLKEHCETDEAIRTHHPLVDAGSMKSSDERGLYWISFPFDVNLSEVFGFGTYGVHWIIMRYNGAARAAQGYWADSEGFWEYIEDRNGVVLKGGMGYVLALDLDLMQATNRTFWSHEIQQVELFFPSTSTAGTITQTTATVEVPAHTCTIDRTNSGGTSPDINKNRTKVDSHWNIIGVPSFANYGTTLTDEGGTVTWKDNTALDWTNDLPFLYEWNANDNTYTVQSGSSYPFKAMHAYYVQYHGTLTWSLASATTPSPIVARRTYAEEPQSEEFRLELRRNDKMEDQTFVKMSNDENASANFVFGEDLTKEKNTKKANIYTLVEGYIPVAGNTLPMSNQTTIVPVGVSIKSTGDYTFSIPEGTDGVGVVLVDEATGIRTSLSALDYTVTLQQGDYTNRFYLEISPIQNTPTGIEGPTSNSSLKGRAQKRIIDGILYIVRDGKIFDARGARVE